MLHAIVHPADIQDRDGGILLLATLFGMYPFLKKLFADGGYQGPEFHTALTKLLPQLETEIIKRSDHAKGFVVLPRRWVVERGSVQILSHIRSGDGFGLHDLRLIERPHVHVALGGPCGADDVAQSRGRQVEA